MRSISLIHPSRGRSDQARKTIELWQKNADKPFEYILCIDNDDRPLMNGYMNIFSVIRSMQDTRTAIQAINEGIKIATGDILVIVSDDFDCPEHWDTLLLEAIGDRTDFCAKTKDGQQYWLITLPIMDRIYYDRFGRVFCPLYDHMYADTDLTCEAHLLGKYINMDIEFHHNHPRYTDQVYDETYKRARATWESGQKVFRERLKSNFNIISDIKLPKDELIKQGIR